MSEDLVVLHCSPTMAGIKTASLFTCPVEDAEALNESLRRFNAILVPKGLRILPVKYMEKRILIYMYRPERLKKDLADPLAKALLSELKYPVDDTELCVARMIYRVNAQKEFPHEIGLFLGYPPRDVEAFIKNQAQNAKYVGTWKVYYDEEKALKTFALYEKCTRIYQEVFHKNAAFAPLVVQVRG
ncbi:MAG: DUF3793 family protein [Lachnospiraceae bacterium]|jgi:hypothetical protein|nr:DUF3793 family protein [Lachnospiraceae bacterium]